MQADQALKRLVHGNQFFVEATKNGETLKTELRSIDVKEGQSPFAIILGCSDSRVPAELVFHCGLGDLFVIRVAGNIVAPSQIGSVEFACQQFGTQLVVVLGHSHCGAINATVDALTGDPDDVSPNIAAIVDRVTPAVMPLIEARDYSSHADLVDKAVHANIQKSVKDIQLRSKTLRGFVRAGRLKIVGAEYSIDSGQVNFHSEPSLP